MVCLASKVNKKRESNKQLGLSALLLALCGHLSEQAVGLPIARRDFLPFKGNVPLPNTLMVKEHYAVTGWTILLKKRQNKRWLFSATVSSDVHGMVLRTIKILQQIN